MKELKVRMTFVEEVLGTTPGDPQLHDTYIASKAPDAKSRDEEVAALGAEEVIERGMTWFARSANGKPIIWDYQIRGFLKESIGALRKVEGTACSTIKSYKKFVDNYVFVTPRQVEIDMHGGKTGECQRPLRAQTMQGERVSIAHSETCPAGSTIDFTVSVLLDDAKSMQAVREALDYARLKGIGQWRNSGRGRATWEEVR